MRILSAIGGGTRVLDDVAYGMRVALRSSAAPLLLGIRWPKQRRVARGPDIPAARWSLRLLSKAALDELFLASELAAGPLVSLGERTRIAREISRTARVHEERGWQADPASYHAAPPPLTRTRRRRLRSRFGPYDQLSFESGYRPPIGEPGRQRWMARSANRRAHAWLLEHPGAPRPWLVCVPGYRMGRPAVDFAGFRTRWLHRTLGLNVAIPVLPLHGPRGEGRRGGDGFLSGDLLDTLHAQSQAVWDVRRLIGWLRRRGAPPIGLHGVSLGAYTASLVASLDSTPDCVIAGIPASDFLDLLRSHAPSFLLRAADRAGFPFEAIDRVLRVVSPLALTPAVPRERRSLYAGVVDRLAPPTQALRLWEHWGRPQIAWYDGGHVSFLWERAVEELICESLTNAGLLTDGNEPIAAISR